MPLYSLRHNGRTCFVPPCFEWDLTDEHGRVTTVSDVDVARLVASQSEREQRIREAHAGRIRLRGRVQEYEVDSGPNAGVKGLRLTVDSIEGQPSGG
jgi:hypothetical protein